MEKVIWGARIKKVAVFIYLPIFAAPFYGFVSTFINQSGIDLFLTHFRPIFLLRISFSKTLTYQMLTGSQHIFETLKRYRFKETLISYNLNFIY